MDRLVSTLAHLQVVAICAAIAYLCLRQSNRLYTGFMLFGGYGLIYGVVPIVVGPTRGQLPHDFEEAALVALVGAVGLSAGWFIPALKPRSASVDVSRARRIGMQVEPLLDWYTLFFATTLLVGFVLLAWSSAGSIGAFFAAESRFAFRGHERFLFLAAAGKALVRTAPVAPFLLMISPRPKRRAVGVAAALVIALFFYAVTKGSREIPISLLGAVGVSFIVRQMLWSRRTNESVRTDRRALRTNKTRTKWSLVAAALLVGVAAVLLYGLRNAGVPTGKRAVVEADVRSIFIGATQNDPLDYSEKLVYAVQIFPHRHDYLWAYPIRRLLLFPLASGGLKPESPNAIFGELVPNTDPGITMPPSLPGEGYVTLGGMAGALIWLIVNGALFRWMAQLQFRSTTHFLTIAPIAAIFTMVSLRGQFYEQALSLTLHALIVFVVCVIARAWSGRSSQRLSPALPGGLTRVGEPSPGNL